MRLAIVGGRDFNDEFLMAEHIAMFMTAYTNEELGPPDIKVISGGAKGADTLGEIFAKIYQVPLQYLDLIGINMVKLLGL